MVSRLAPFTAPSRFDTLAGALLLPLWAAAALLGAAGLALGLLHAPADVAQGDAGRILLVQTPTACLALLAWVAMAGLGVASWTFNARRSALLARALAPSGAICALLAVVTGAFWRRSVLGTWWAWDARPAFELVLLLLFVGYLAIVGAIDDPRRADRAGTLVAMLGALDLPLIHSALQAWGRLHHGTASAIESTPRVPASMVLALMLTTLALLAWMLAMVLVRARAGEHDRKERSAHRFDTAAHATSAPMAPTTAPPAGLERRMAA